MRFLFVAILVVGISCSSQSREVTASTFLEYAALPDLSADEIYTVELLIDRAYSKVDPDYWETALELERMRGAADYKPAIPRERLRQAASQLDTLTWLNFQRLKRPLRDVTALRYVPELTSLILQKNEISDISAIRCCKKMQRLSLAGNPVRDLSALSACSQIQELDISGCTLVSDVSVLGLLPRLRELTISSEQLPAIGKLFKLAALQVLDIDSDEPIASFEALPPMPELRTIRGAKVHSLRGLEKYAKLEHLTNLSGDFDSLEPLRGATCLTHANMWNTRVFSFAPLSKLSALREFRIETINDKIDLTPLAALPKLHGVTVKSPDGEHPELAKLRASLSSWDTEFFNPAPRHTPSLKLEVVDQKTFDHFDTEEHFGLTTVDTNKRLLESERDWLEEKIEAAFLPLQAGEDIYIPFQWNGGRSLTVVLQSDKALKAFPKLILALQKVISHSKHDWIIYFQSENEDFIVWVYPEKIVVTAKYADTVRRLIRGN